MRKHLKHPSGLKFSSSGGSVEWPLDRFTRRRIADGSVKVVEAGKSEPPRRQQHHRNSAETA